MVAEGAGLVGAAVVDMAGAVFVPDSWDLKPSTFGQRAFVPRGARLVVRPLLLLRRALKPMDLPRDYRVLADVGRGDAVVVAAGLDEDFAPLVTLLIVRSCFLGELARQNANCNLESENADSEQGQLRPGRNAKRSSGNVRRFDFIKSGFATSDLEHLVHLFRENSFAPHA